MACTCAQTCCTSACVIGMRPPPSPQAAPTAASPLCPYRCPWTIAIQADPTPVYPTWTPAIATCGHWWCAHLRCVRWRAPALRAPARCLPVLSRSPVGHGELESSKAAGRRPQARRTRRLLRLPPCRSLRTGGQPADRSPYISQNTKRPYFARTPSAARRGASSLLYLHDRE